MGNAGFISSTVVCKPTKIKILAFMAQGMQEAGQHPDRGFSLAQCDSCTVDGIRPALPLIRNIP